MGTDNADTQPPTSGADYHLTDFVPKPMPAAIGQPPETRLGERVQTARNHFGLSVDALSRLTKATDHHEGRGVSSTALLRYEAGEALPGARELRLLSEALGVSVDWLVTGNVIDGLTAAEQELLAALSKLHRLNADRQAVGDGVAFSIAHIQRRERLSRIAEAKRRV